MFFNNSFPKIIHWHICGKCQLNCAYCYAIPGEAIRETEKCKEIIKKISNGKIKVIVFTGGEPLLRSDIVEIINFAHKMGLFTALDTNGLLLTKEIISEFNGILDRIGLPLDGASSEVHDRLRGRGNFKIIINALKLLNLYGERINIKINTVVTKENFWEIEKIGKILMSFKNISLWSLYQFFPLGRGWSYRKRFKIYKYVFEEIGNKVRDTYPNLNIEIVPFSIRKGSYFSISPNGVVYTTPLNGRATHVKLGNIFEEDISELWNKSILKKDKNLKRYVKQLKLFSF
jgi:MoaA/NifB/PqqE/SkfB family radical SAM enzyme